ncbi:monosaccharide ABC transporter membrane protein, CUT2 family [Bradyrhizobium sp. Ghvi]|uniref:ABC transporter permease n=1 Tax=Bradyrhizobium sp. Ghvi TaxID=1855319 RepID=UPI0008E47758|nr:ABC transporter permease [Bradyrhizobium sp. Ghvi]SFP76688.1 monosaccharide ABC transporter membrane protein, CUT2 family [Bradyrhizobium sp. Ghvi]
MSTYTLEAGRSNLQESIRRSYGLIQSVAVLLVLVVVMSIVSPRFASVINIQNLMAQMSAALIVAAGMTIVMINGEFDISVGAVLALTASIAGKLMPEIGITATFALALVVGPLFGRFAGVVVTRFGIPSFITTLGTMMIARSLAFVTTQGQVVSNVPEAFRILGLGRPLGIPMPFIIAILTILAGYVLLNHTAFGKKVYAIGANRNVAALSGINVDRIKIICLMICGLCASFAGMVLLARIGSIQADTARGLEFEVIAGVVIGGVSLSGGQGNILRVIIGVVVIALIRNFLNLARIDIFWQDFATGSIILAAVLLDALQKRIAGSR